MKKRIKITHLCRLWIIESTLVLLWGIGLFFLPYSIIVKLFLFVGFILTLGGVIALKLKKMRESIFKSKVFFSIIDMAKESYFYVLPNRKIFYVNRSIRNFGLDEEQMKGKDFFEEIDLEYLDRDDEMAIDQVFLGNLKSFNTYLKIFDEDGRYWDIHGLFENLYQEDGIRCGVIVSLKNISKLKKFKEKRFEMERINKDQNMYFSSMTHEMRTPLNVLLGHADILKETSLNKEQKNHVQVIKESGDILLRLVNNILDLAKFSSKKDTLEEIDFKLVGLMEGLVQFFSPNFQKKGLDISYVIEEHALKGMFLSGDRHKIHQILMNFIGNAYKFTEKGGVTLRVSRGKEIDDTHFMVIFSVEDTGIGMTDEERQRIFDAYSQANNSTQRKYGGTGLGLSISQKIVKLMNGKISCESEKGVGTKMIFEIPLKKGKHKESEEELSEAGVSGEDLSFLKEKKVMVVDDSQDNIELIKIYFKNQVFEYSLYTKPTEALMAFEHNKFDLVFTDMQMPEMDGIELIKKMREVEKRRGDHHLSKIVMLSANESRGLLEQVKEAGGDGYMTKPIKKKSLISFIIDQFSS